MSTSTDFMDMDLLTSDEDPFVASPAGAMDQEGPTAFQRLLFKDVFAVGIPGEGTSSLLLSLSSVLGVDRETRSTAGVFPPLPLHLSNAGFIGGGTRHLLWDTLRAIPHEIGVVGLPATLTKWTCHTCQTTTLWWCS